MGYEFNAVEVFEIAIAIEENGRKFYEQAGAKITSPGVKELFAYLAAEEVKHKERFAALKAELPKSATEDDIWDPENEMSRYLKMMADIHVFRSDREVDKRLAELGDEVDALNLAMGFEKDSIIFFLAMKEVTGKKQGQEKIDQLVKEEQEHLKKLSLKLKEITG